MYKLLHFLAKLVECLLNFYLSLLAPLLWLELYYSLLSGDKPEWDILLSVPMKTKEKLRRLNYRLLKLIEQKLNVV